MNIPSDAFVWKTTVRKYTVVGDYTNKMKTTFYFNFDLYQASEQHGYTKTWKQRETSIKKLLFNYFETFHSEKAC